MKLKCQWMFQKKGVVTIGDASTIKNREAFELAAIDAGAEDIRLNGKALEIICHAKNLVSVANGIERLGLKPDHSGIEYLAKDPVEVQDAAVRQSLGELIGALEENEDVDAVYTNEAEV